MSLKHQNIFCSIKFYKSYQCVVIFHFSCWTGMCNTLHSLGITRIVHTCIVRLWLYMIHLRQYWWNLKLVGGAFSGCDGSPRSPSVRPSVHHTCYSWLLKDFWLINPIYIMLLPVETPPMNEHIHHFADFSPSNLNLVGNRWCHTTIKKYQETVSHWVSPRIITNCSVTSVGKECEHIWEEDNAAFVTINNVEIIEKIFAEPVNKNHAKVLYLYLNQLSNNLKQIKIFGYKTNLVFPPCQTEEEMLFKSFDINQFSNNFSRIFI